MEANGSAAAGVPYVGHELGVRAHVTEPLPQPLPLQLPDTPKVPALILSAFPVGS